MTSIGEILLQQGRHAAESRRSRSSAWQPFVQQLAQVPGQIMQDRAAEQAGQVAAQEAAFDRQQQRDVRQGQIDKGNDERAAATATADQKRQMNEILASEGVFGPDQMFNASRAQEIARSKGYTEIVDDILSFGQENNDAVAKAASEKARGVREEATFEGEQFDRRQTANQQGVRRMIGESVAARGGAPIGPADRQTLQGMAFQEGVSGADMDRLLPEEKPDTRSLQQQANDALRSGDTQGYSRIMRVIRESASAERAPQVRSNDPGPLETIIGPDGTPIRVSRADAVGRTPASGTSRPASGLEKRAFNFFNRARQADGDLEALETEVQAMGLGGQARMSWAPNMLQSETGQLYTQAQRAFTEARLRKDSGAAIPDHEFESDRQTYFVQPGDGPDVQAQKRRARAAVLASLGLESGQALSEFEGDPDAAAGIVQQYRQRSARPQATPQPGAGRGRTSGAGPAGTTQSGPRIGERRMIDGVMGEWNGSAWVEAR